MYSGYLSLAREASKIDQSVVGDYLNDLFTNQQLRPDSIKLWPTRRMTICHDIDVLRCPFVLVILGAKCSTGWSIILDRQTINSWAVVSFPPFRCLYRFIGSINSPSPPITTTIISLAPPPELDKSSILRPTERIVTDTFAPCRIYHEPINIILSE